MKRLPGWPVVKIGALNLALAGLWVWLFRAIFPYLGVIFTREEFRTNQIVLALAAALVVMQVRRGDFPVDLGSLPHPRPWTLGLLLGGALLYLASERFLNINTLSATLFGLSAYGLVGLWMPAQAWRQGLPAALLLVGALPFGEHMQTFVGYPVRVLTARVVQAGLSSIGVQSVGVDTILVFETGVSKVDLPCSGIKSLWTGGLFYLAATWIERRRVDGRWLLGGLGLVVALLAANLARVGVLVVTGEVAGWRLLAEMLHVPLGVLGFVAACGLGLLLLRAAGKLPRPELGPKPLEREAVEPAGFLALRPALLLAAALGLMGLLYVPRPVVAEASPAADYAFPANLVVEDWPLTRGEREWLAEAGVQSVRRWHFRWEPAAAQGQSNATGPLLNSPLLNSPVLSGPLLSGSMLFVTSDTWRAHHRPERCFEVYGLTVNQSTSALAGEDFPVRLLWLEDQQGRQVLNAAYWLQSRDTLTDDYATRIWADLEPERSTWVLATVLFDRPVDPASQEADVLYGALRDVIAAELGK